MSDGQGIYSQKVVINLENIIAILEQLRREAQERKALRREFILRRERDNGKLLDLALHLDASDDAEVEKLLVAIEDAREARQIVGPANKKRPPIDELE